MRDGKWRTPRQIAEQTGDPVMSVSTQLRHLRKLIFGGHTVNPRHVEQGLLEYQIAISSGIEKAVD